MPAEDVSANITIAKRVAEKLAGLGPKAKGVAEEWYVQNVTATVAAVDDDQRLVVLSVGRDQTVKPGYEFVIYQDDPVAGLFSVRPSWRQVFIDCEIELRLSGRFLLSLPLGVVGDTINLLSFFSPRFGPPRESS